MHKSARDGKNKYQGQFGPKNLSVPKRKIFNKIENKAKMKNKVVSLGLTLLLIMNVKIYTPNKYHGV